MADNVNRQLGRGQNHFLTSTNVNIRGRQNKREKHFWKNKHPPKKILQNPQLIINITSSSLYSFIIMSLTT